MGFFSHQTALSLHSLSDVMPARVHLTLPAGWARRRFRVPADVVLHFSDVGKPDRAWVGSVPVTSVRRTLLDVRNASVSPELVEQATRQAIARGLIGKKDAADLKKRAAS